MSQASGGKSGSQPQTRRDRRAAERATRANQRAGRKQSPPTWQSPIILLTGAAVIIGLAIVLFAVIGRPAASPPSNELIPPSSTVPAGLADGRTLGSAQAPVQLDVWADFQCPFCGQLARDIEPSTIEDFVVPGYARIVFHDLAFLGQRSNSSWDESVEAASAARCAADQGLFWQMHDWLYANQNAENEGAFSQERLRSIAQAAGLDMASYDSCMAAGDKQTAVESETSDGFAQGINSTPTIFINGSQYKGSLTAADLSAAIRSAVGTASPAALPSQPATTPGQTASP